MGRVGSTVEKEERCGPASYLERNAIIEKTSILIKLIVQTIFFVRREKDIAIALLSKNLYCKKQQKKGILREVMENAQSAIQVVLRAK